MLRNDVFPSRFVKASDLPKPKSVKIKSAEMETLKTPQGLAERKLVLQFDGFEKCLATNRTNFDTIAALHGHDTNGWVGKPIELFASRTHVRGRETDCVRVRRAAERGLQ